MTVINIIEGLHLINKYRPLDQSDYHFRAEHDSVWAGSLDWAMPEVDKKRMEELSWEPDEGADGWRAMV